MRQANEIGFTVCRTPSGQLTHGPVATGTPTSVNIPVVCPPGSKLIALHHSHPGGIARPSRTDVETAIRVKAKHLCIQVPETGELKCFRVLRK